MKSQKSEPFETPPREEIPGTTRGHVEAMEASDGEPEETWVMYNMSHLMLRTIGRSGVAAAIPAQNFTKRYVDI